MNFELGAHAIIHFYPPTTWSASALSRVRGYYIYKEIWKVSVGEQIPYTRVNKRIRLFPKLQENMHLLPNMC